MGQAGEEGVAPDPVSRVSWDGETSPALPLNPIIYSTALQKLSLHI